MYYKVLIFKSDNIKGVTEGIEKLVDNEIVKGWQPLGGVSLAVSCWNGANEYIACQAVTYSD